MIRLGPGIFSEKLQGNLKNSTNQLATAKERLGSGLRINRTSDDPAGIALVSDLNVDRKVARQGIKNLNDGADLVDIADTAITELISIMDRIEELATLANSETLTSSQRQTLQNEVSALQNESNRIIQTTTYNGKLVLSGSGVSTRLQSGSDGNNSLAILIGAQQLQSGIEGYSGGTSLVSSASDGTQGNSLSINNSISADGRYMVFMSASDNLIAGDSNGTLDVFRKDLLTGETIRVSTASDGSQANGYSSAPSISADGRYVVFQSDASNLVAGDTNMTTDIFRKDLLTGETIRVNTDSNDTEAIAGGSVQASISADGRYVTFSSDATNLVAGDINTYRDIFRKDLTTGSLVLVSSTTAGVQGNQTSTNAKLSADGRFVVFESVATNLVAGDINSLSDIFVKDLSTGTLTRVSTSSIGDQSTSSIYGMINASISADGRYVIFETDADDLTGDDPNGLINIFRKNLETGEIIRVNTSSNGDVAMGGAYGGVMASISSDGRYVLFSSDADNLVAGDTNATLDIFRKDLLTGETIRVTVASNGTEANGGSLYGVMSADGRKVVYASMADNLVDNDSNGQIDIFVSDLSQTGLQEVAGLSVANYAIAGITATLAGQKSEELAYYQAGLAATNTQLNSFLGNLKKAQYNYGLAASKITNVDQTRETSNAQLAAVRQNSGQEMLEQNNKSAELGLELITQLKSTNKMDSAKASNVYKKNAKNDDSF